MAKLLIFQDGTRLTTDQIRTYVLTPGSNEITLTLVDNSSKSVKVPDMPTGLVCIDKLDQVFSEDLTKGGVEYISAGIVLLSCTPMSFVALNAEFTVKGYGFTPDVANGKIRLEDMTGGFDDNGYSYTITYIDEYTLTATYAATGDGVLGGAYGSMIYYKSADGVYSNAVININAT